MFSILLLLGPMLFGALVQAYSSPGACSGACWAHDPCIIQRESDGTYFKFNTGSGIYIYTADAIEGPWTQEGVALEDGSSIDLDGNTDLWVSAYISQFEIHTIMINSLG